MPTTPRNPGTALTTVLLDIDGTLIDSNDGHARAWVAAFAEHGYVVPFDQVRALIGKGGDKLLPELTGLDPESAEGKRISVARGEIFARRELPTLRATPGARALLEHLTARGLELVVATSAQAQEVTAILTQAGVADLIQVAASSDDADASKPDPDIVIAALRKAGRQAANAAMLGDTPYDIVAATRARVPVIALRTGGWPDDALDGAAAIYDDPADLLAHFDDSPLAAGVAAA
ncbi:MAG: hydrolase, haloacid dehalogenase-like family [Gemmatimonadetes bacterium]|jgi:phosphoglycolate phosphatase-like HAD superfamily hydrolase|nr:hydrolase, haloacid dehalogenase-like family [Gemmatimonadota bacterium]